MKQLYFLSFSLFIVFGTFSQQMPIDFSNNVDIFNAFNGSTFTSRNNPDDSSDKVGQFFNDGTNTWQGFYTNLTRPVDFSSNKIVKLNFYRFDPNAHNIVLKFEQGGTDPDVEVKVDIPAGSGNSWVNDIEFDFSNATTNGNAINASGAYNKIVIFIDGGISNKPPGTFLIDNITDGSAATDPNVLDVEYTNLVWSDEFDGNSLNTSKWHHQTIGIVNGGWANGELQHYTDSPTNSFVANGNLHIVAKKETINQNGVDRNYTSARLNSKFAFTYGRVDVKAKLPQGDGTWPAIWTLGKNISETGAYWQTEGFGTTPWPDCGEIDIMEHGLHATNVVSSALHTPSSSGATVNTATKMLSDVANDFHVYSMNWSPNEITFLIDDVVHYRYNPSTKNSSTWPFDLEQFLLLNVAIGGYSGTPDSNFTETSMIIDYVKIYQESTASTDNFFSSKFRVYPNPTSSEISIKTNEKIDKVEIFSTLGQKVYSENTPNKKLNISSLRAGLYLLKIYSKNNIATKKIVVKK